MIGFLFFIAILYLGGVLAVTLPYWYERGNSQCEDIPSATASPRSVIKLWLDAAWHALMIGAAIPLDPIFRHIENADSHEDKDDLPPVLLIHGLYHNPSGWMFLRKELRRAGFRKIHVVKYSSGNTTLDAVTEKLEEAAKSVENQYAGRKFLLVGHSLGGLIIRNWLGKAANQERALGAVTLSAPLNGSKMAAVAFGALGKSIIPSNPFFADLARNESPAAIPCVALVTEADTMVLPQQNLVPVTKGWTMRLAPYTSHAGMMCKGSVMRMAVWELHRMLTDAAPVKPAQEIPGQPERATEPEKHEAPTAAAPARKTVETPAGAPAKEPAPAGSETSKPEPLKTEPPKPGPSKTETPETGKTAPTAPKAKSAAKNSGKPIGEARPAGKKSAPPKKSKK